MKRKLISILLLLAMIVTMLPAMTMTSFAADESNHNGNHSGWIAVYDENDLPEYSEDTEKNGKYYLANDIELTKTWTVPFGTTELCLNGHVMKYNSTETGSIISIPTDMNTDDGVVLSTLKIFDCKKTKHRFSVDEKGLWVLDEKHGNEVVQGGCITGGKASGLDFLSGGIELKDGMQYYNDTSGDMDIVYATLEMHGGNIVGNTTSSEFSSYSTGIYAGMYSNCNLSDVDIFGNVGMMDGAISFAVFSSATINNCDISYNICNGYQSGGIRIFPFSNCTISNCNISNNKGCEGGGIGSAGQLKLENCSIADNSAKNGGGIYMLGQADDVEINNCNISSNIAEESGGGICSQLENEFKIGNTSICNNSAYVGGGIYIANFPIELSADKGKSTIIADNKAEYCGGVRLSSWYKNKLSGSIIIKENKANKSGNNLVIDKNTDSDGTEGTLEVGNLSGSEIYYSTYSNGWKNVIEGGIYVDVFCVEPASCIVTSGYNTNNPNTKPNDYFHYDGVNEYCPLITDKGELEVGTPPEGNNIISTSSDGHGLAVLDCYYAQQGGKVRVIINSNDGYMLKTLKIYDSNGEPIEGIKLNKLSENEYEFTMPDCAIEIKVEFEKKSISDWPKMDTYTVRFDLQGHGDAIHDKYVASGFKIHSKPDTPTADGYIFGGWYKDSACTQEWDWDKDVVTSDMTLYAKWISTDVAKTAIKSLKAGKKNFTVKVKKVAGAEKYQVRYSLKKSMKNAVKKSFSVGKVSKTVKKLKAKKTYYVQVRTLKKIEGKTYYSGWSKAKKVRTK